MLAQYKATSDRYENLRALALKVSHEQLPKIIKNKQGVAILKSEISLRGLDFETYETLARWKSSDQRVVKWDWDDVRRLYKAHPKRFELSIWHRDLFLCGASIGKPTQSGSKLRVDFIEAAPENSILDGVLTDLVIVAGTMYAKAIGASQIRIMKPVNEKVKDYYLSKPGFLFDAKGNFCFKDI